MADGFSIQEPFKFDLDSFNKNQREEQKKYEVNNQAIAQQNAIKNPPATGFGTVSQNNGQSVGYNDKQTEIDRTMGVINNRNDQGLDNKSQLEHYKNLTGKDYVAPFLGSGSPTGPTSSRQPGSTDKKPDGSYITWNDSGTGYSSYDKDGNFTGSGIAGTENYTSGGGGGGSSSGGSTQQGNAQFDQAFKQMQTMYDEKFASMQKMIEDLTNTLKYNQHQQSQAPPISSPQSSGQHIFDSQNGVTGSDSVGYTQNNNSMNEALFRYLDNTWNGGF